MPFHKVVCAASNWLVQRMRFKQSGKLEGSSVARIEHEQSYWQHIGMGFKDVCVSVATVRIVPVMAVVAIC